MTYPGRLRGRYNGLGAKKKTLFKFSFFSYFKKVAINDFAMHLIMSKCLRRQKCRKKKRQKDIEVKEEIAYENVFIHLNT